MVLHFRISIRNCWVFLYFCCLSVTMKRKEREEDRDGSETKRPRTHVFLTLPVEVWCDIVAMVPRLYWRAVLQTCRTLHDIVPAEKPSEKGIDCKDLVESPISFLEWLILPTKDSVVYHVAARYGRLDILQWGQRRCPSGVWKESVCIKAATGGHLDILIWARDQDPPLPWDGNTAIFAAQEGHWKVVKWTWAQNLPSRSSAICSYAARQGRLDMLQWARKRGYDWNYWVYIEAAQNGHVDVLQWAMDNDCPEIPGDGHDLLPIYAAERGQVKVLEWARDLGCILDTHVCQRAARYGHLNVIQWLRTQDPPCPWGGGTCAYAAKGGHLNVLQWARAHGCPWDHRTRDMAIKKQHNHVLQWLDDHGCPTLDYSTFSVERVI